MRKIMKSRNNWNNEKKNKMLFIKGLKDVKQDM